VVITPFTREENNVRNADSQIHILENIAGSNAGSSSQRVKLLMDL